MIVWIFTTHTDELIPRDAKTLWIASHVLAEESLVEVVMTSWHRSVKPNAKRPSVAYFCMEYGINHVVKIYSGGLGMLALKKMGIKKDIYHCNEGHAALCNFSVSATTSRRMA